MEPPWKLDPQRVKASMWNHTHQHPSPMSFVLKPSAEMLSVLLSAAWSQLLLQEALLGIQPCLSSYSSNMGISKLDQIWPSTCFVNKVLLERIHTHSLLHHR